MCKVEELLDLLLKVLEERFFELDELGVIPGLPESCITLDSCSIDNASPGDLFVLVDKKLGIYSGCLKAVFVAAYTKFMVWCRSRESHGSGAGISDGEGKTIAALGGHSIQSLSRVVALLHGECMTAWNVRKQLLRDGILCGVCELHVTKLALYIRPKSPEVFIHKRFVSTALFSQAVQKGDSELSCLHTSAALFPDRGLPIQARCPNSEARLREELQCCEVAADRYANNYAAWQHRLWLLRLLVDKSGCCAKAVSGVLDSEVTQVERWLSSNVSQFSAMNYFLGLVHFVCHMQDFTQALGNGQEVQQGELGSWLLQRLDVSSSMLALYPGHEALWMYRQGLLHVTLCHRHGGSKVQPECTFHRASTEPRSPLPAASTTESSSAPARGSDTPCCCLSAPGKERGAAATRPGALPLPSDGTDLRSALQASLTCWLRADSRPHAVAVSCQRSKQDSADLSADWSTGSTVHSGAAGGGDLAVNACDECRSIVRRDDDLVRQVLAANHAAAMVSTLASRHIRFMQRLAAG